LFKNGKLLEGWIIIEGKSISEGTFWNNQLHGPNCKKMCKFYKAEGNFENDTPTGNHILYISYVDLDPEPTSPGSPNKVKNWIYTYYGHMNEGKIGDYGGLKHQVDNYIYVGPFVNRKPEGQGYYEDLTSSAKYTGEFQAGYFQGKGTLDGKDLLFEGEF